MDDFDIILLGVAVSIKNKQRKRRQTKRNVWVKSWLERRPTHGHSFLLKELQHAPDDYRNFLRMDEELFLNLLSLVSPLITKHDTVMRKAISPADRLAVTLRFLATGNSFEDLKFSSYMSANTISGIVEETCNALCIVLKDYIQIPKCSAEWKSIAEGFRTRWNFPHCVGALDGKHISIVKPQKSGSFYYNYKGHFSVVLMALVNANYEFMMADCGINGRVSDGGVIAHTTFGRKLVEGKLGLPEKELVPNHQVELPYVFVGDDAFSLSANLLKPYKGTKLSVDQRVFNYRLSRARGLSENAFGILASRFRILQKPIYLCPTKVRKVVLACTYLHNYIRRNRSTNYIPIGSVDMEVTQTGEKIPGSWRSEGFVIHALQLSKRNNFSQTAEHVRTNFKDYFNGPGSVTWQNKSISLQ